MGTGAQVAAAVASGYLLGRTKKLKLAITVGSLIAGKKMGTNPNELLQQGLELAMKNPEVSKISEQVRGKLLDAVKAAAIAAATHRLESRRIPDSADILALYEVEADNSAELVGYKRTARYSRGQASRVSEQ